MKNNEKGFTLVEVLASMTLLFIILFSFFTIFTQSALFTRTNEDSLQATNLADRVMEVIRANETTDKESLRSILIDEELVNEGCQVNELFNEGCQSEKDFSLRIEILDTHEELGLTSVSIQIAHKDRKHILATRHFYLNE